MSERLEDKARRYLQKEVNYDNAFNPVINWAIPFMVWFANDLARQQRAEVIDTLDAAKELSRHLSVVSTDAITKELDREFRQALAKIAAATEEQK